MKFKSKLMKFISKLEEIEIKDASFQKESCNLNEKLGMELCILGKKIVEKSFSQMLNSIIAVQMYFKK